jgi:hypothetical protein
MRRLAGAGVGKLEGARPPMTPARGLTHFTERGALRRFEAEDREGHFARRDRPRLRCLNAREEIGEMIVAAQFCNASKRTYSETERTPA